MKSEAIEIVRGSGNVFRELGHASPDVAQLKALLAAEIIKMLDREGLTVRAAHARTGIAAADFSRIRTADLGRFASLADDATASRRIRVCPSGVNNLVPPVTTGQSTRCDSSMGRDSL